MCFRPSMDGMHILGCSSGYIVHACSLSGKAHPAVLPIEACERSSTLPEMKRLDRMLCTLYTYMYSMGVANCG